MAETFVNIDDTYICNKIKKFQHKCIFVAPGISKKIAETIEERANKLPEKDIQLILDIDAETCRLGYGDIKGLQKAQELFKQECITLSQQPGVRVGLLIVDDETFVYSPTPLLIETGSHSQDKPNGICVDSSRGTQAIEEAWNIGHPNTNLFFMEPYEILSANFGA